MGRTSDQESPSPDAHAQQNTDPQLVATATRENGGSAMTLDKQKDDASNRPHNDPKDGKLEGEIEVGDGLKEGDSQKDQPEIAIERQKDQQEAGVDEEGPETQNSDSEERPPLPPRPSLLQTAEQPFATHSTSKRPGLTSKPTTALSSVDIQTLSFPDGSRGTFSTPAHRTVSDSLSVSGISTGQSTPHRKVSQNGSELDDNTSLRSYAPTLRANGDLASLLDEGLNSQSPAWKLLSTQSESVNPFESVDYENISLINFGQEFDQIEAVDAREGNEGMRFFGGISGISNHAF
jgi:hypothetical protein